jgi:wyosine [tRNA(Phe)-imidazoG37] synthetase (radical SAM superfamily)
MDPTPRIALRQYKTHSRNWRDNLYVYPVISRRSGGLSIGINLNPDAACNFDCIYCQVDRTVPPKIREVDAARLGEELSALIDHATSGGLFSDPAFADVPTDRRAIKDIAFSGDGEPTTCTAFRECVDAVAGHKRSHNLPNTKIVLITDACYLTRPEVRAGLAIMDANQGEVWAKLDAGTEEYYRLINRPNFPLTHVIENIISTAQIRPVVIQSLFMRVHDVPPSSREISAYIERLAAIARGGGTIRLVQVYTVARKPARSFVAPLTDAEVDAIRTRVQREAGVAAESFYGMG